MFDLLFSAEGTVGRGVWWIMQLVYIGVVWILFIVLCMFLAQEQAKRGVKFDGPSAQMGHMSLQQKAHDVDVLVNIVLTNKAKLAGFGIAFLIVYWSNLAIEIKRWHDMGHSGAWCLLRFLPAGVYFPGVLKSQMVMIVFLCSLGLIGLIRFILLAFWKGYDDRPVPTYRAPRHESQPATTSSSSSHQGGGGSFVAPVVGVLIIGAIAWAFYSGAVSMKSMASAISTNFTSSSKGMGPVQSNPEIGYHGTTDAQFAKDWVMVGGEKLTGISSVLPARGGKVLIVYADGGKSTYVSALPQGFLDDWNITPERLQELDK